MSNNSGDNQLLLIEKPTQEMATPYPDSKDNPTEDELDAYTPTAPPPTPTDEQIIHDFYGEQDLSCISYTLVTPGQATNGNVDNTTIPGQNIHNLTEKQNTKTLLLSNENNITDQMNDQKADRLAGAKAKTTTKNILYKPEIFFQSAPSLKWPLHKSDRALHVVDAEIADNCENRINVALQKLQFTEDHPIKLESVTKEQSEQNGPALSFQRRLYIPIHRIDSEPQEGDGNVDALDLQCMRMGTFSNSGAKPELLTKALSEQNAKLISGNQKQSPVHKLETPVLTYGERKTDVSIGSQLTPILSDCDEEGAYGPPQDVLNKSDSKTLVFGKWDLKPLQMSPQSNPTRISPRQCQADPFEDGYVQKARNSAEFHLNPGTVPCKSSQCKMCKHVIQLSQISGPLGKMEITEQFNCNSKNTIYALICKECGKIYVGQSERCLRLRYGEHRNRLKQNSKFEIYTHFSQVHKEDDMKITGIRTAPEDSKERKALEQNIISELGTQVPKGLNSYYKGG